jgi:drug/metabolite transporter (DMT)-like permease
VNGLDGPARPSRPPGITDNLRGSLWMVAAMAGFAVEDAGIKHLARDLPLGLILLVEGLTGVLWFAWAARRETALPWSRRLGLGLAIRSGFELIGRLFYALAVVFVPISLAGAILQATPLVVVPVAARMFGERVGARRWAAILGGFLGVLIVLRPGMGGLGATAGLAVLGMAGFAGRDLATRALPSGLSNARLGVAGFAVLALSGALILAVTGGAAWPSAPQAAALAGLTLAGLSGYAALTQAMRTGEVSAVTPLRYVRLIFAVALGILVFGERPDLTMALGSTLIVGCGLVVLLPRGVMSRRR